MSKKVNDTNYELIRVRRKQKKLTQAELAKKLNTTRQTVIGWEKGVFMPEREVLQKLMNELDIKVGEYYKTVPDKVNNDLGNDSLITPEVVSAEILRTMSALTKLETYMSAKQYLDDLQILKARQMAKELRENIWTIYMKLNENN